MPESPPRRPPQKVSPALQQLPDDLLLAVLTECTSFFCLQNLRVTCKRINERLSSKESRACHAIRASGGIIDRALVIISKTGRRITYHALVNGNWKQIPLNAGDHAWERGATAIAPVASGAQVLCTGRKSYLDQDLVFRSLLINIGTGQRDVMPRQKAPRQYAAVCHHGNCTILAGGVNPSTEETLATIEMFDSATDEWTCLPDMPHATSKAFSGVIDQKIYVACGTSGDDDGNGSTLLQIYDTVTKTWDLGPDMPDYLHNSSGVVLNGKLYVVGRSQASNSYVCVYFTPESMEWKCTATIDIGREKPRRPRYELLPSLDQRCHAVGHNGSLWVLCLKRDTTSHWRELKDDGEWSRIPSAIAPEIPYHLVGNIKTVVSSVLMP